MVSGKNQKNIKICPKIIIATLLMVAFLFPNIIQAKISNEDLKEVTTSLGIANFPFLDKYSEEDFKNILNQLIKPKESKLTYGILVMGAFDEVEFIDAILSQEFLNKNRTYFESILDERISLFNHWKKTGQTIYKVWKKGSSATPFTLLAMESVEIINKTMEIFNTFETLKSTRKYRGLWIYLDTRITNDSHGWAWELAKAEMQWAGSPDLEQQFLALYQKWGPYATQTGINDEYKKQLKEELTDTLVVALEEYKLAEEKRRNQPSWVAQQIEEIKGLAAIIRNGVNSIVSAISNLDLFSAGPVAKLPETVPKNEDEAQDQPVETTSELIEAKPPSTENEMSKAKPPSTEPPSITAATTTTIAATTTTTATTAMATSTTATATTATDEIKEAEPPSSEPPSVEPPLTEEDVSKPGFCKKTAIPLPGRYRVLINEVAWMGNENSHNDEWIELKNIWGIPVKLEGWQLLDKDLQIKVVFTEEDIIPANGYYLLERTDDESAPKAEADKIYTGVLSNSNEALYLFDADCRLEDEVAADPKWPAGDNSKKITMERFEVANWYSGIAGGTPGKENSSPPSSSFFEQQATTPATTGSPSPIAAQQSSPKILITEVQIRDASSSDHDSIELYNTESESKDISGFQLKKKSSNGTEYSISLLPANSIIQPHGYFIWSNFATTADATTTQNLAANNSIALLDEDKNIIDAVAWGSSTDPFVEGSLFPENPNDSQNLGRKYSTSSQSYIDTNDNENDFELQIPTIGTQNQNSGYYEEEEEESEEPENSTLSVVINEIAWMGTEAAATDEWIELYNNTTSTIDLTGWRLVADDGSPDITLSTSSISAGGYFLIERTDDNAVSDTPADWFGSFGQGGLNNHGERLELRDERGGLRDVVDAADDWFAGEASLNYISMERINSASSSDSDNWASNNRVPWDGWQGKDAGGNRINGTPRSQNSVSKDSTPVNGFNIDDDFNLVPLGSPYIIDGFIDVSSGGNLTIQAETILKFKQDSGVNIEGELNSSGTTFTAYDENQYWDWLYFKDGSKGELEDTIVEKGGQLPCPGFSVECTFNTDTEAIIKAEGAEIEIKDSVIKNSDTRGLWASNTEVIIQNTQFLNNGNDNYNKGYTAAIHLEGDDSEVIIENSTFQNNDVGIRIATCIDFLVKNNIFTDNVTPIETNSLCGQFSGNEAENNTESNGILITGFGLIGESDQISLQKDNIPYVIENRQITIPASSTAIIQPGVIIKFKEGREITVNGTLKAQGNQNEKIIFTAFSDDGYGGDTNNDSTSTSLFAGYWDYIEFSASSTNSILEHVVVRGGGFYQTVSWHAGAITAEEINLVLKDVLIENNRIGVELRNEANFSSSTEGVVIKNNRIGIWRGSDCPNLNGITFEENEDNDIWPSGCGP